MLACISMTPNTAQIRVTHRNFTGLPPLLTLPSLWQLLHDGPFEALILPSAPARNSDLGSVHRQVLQTIGLVLRSPGFSFSPCLRTTIFASIDLASATLAATWLGEGALKAGTEMPACCCLSKAAAIEAALATTQTSGKRFMSSSAETKGAVTRAKLQAHAVAAGWTPLARRGGAPSAACALRAS